jgi:hypothetical protein
MRHVTGAALLVFNVAVSSGVCAQEDPLLRSTLPNAAGGSRVGKPANICQELLAYVRQPDPAPKPAAQTAQLSTAVNAPSRSAVEAKPDQAAGAPQQASGLSGQVTTSGPGASGPQGATQNAAAPTGSTATASGPASPGQQGSQPAQGQAAPQPASAKPPVRKPTPEAVQQVEAAATSNDLGACRRVAQEMRRAGLAMPEALIALAAMDPKLLEGADRP